MIHDRTAYAGDKNDAEAVAKHLVTGGLTDFDLLLRPSSLRAFASHGLTEENRAAVAAACRTIQPGQL